MNRLEKFCLQHAEPVNAILHILAFVLLIYGLWIHNFFYILDAILLAIIGHAQFLIRKGKKEKEEEMKEKEKERKEKGKKRGALEISVSTIIIIVIGVTMLILGLVLVRSIMCAAIGLTGEITDKIRREIHKIFEETGEEATCIGMEMGEINLIAGKENFIWCGINAKKEAYYEITVGEISGIDKKWIVGKKGWSGTLSKETIEKIMRISIPKDAEEEAVQIYVTIKKDNTILKDNTRLDFQIRRMGWFTGAMC